MDEEKRFLVIYHDEEGGHRIRVADEKRVSDDIDMQDCHGESMDIFWLNDDGKLIPVTVGKTERRGSLEENFIYAYSPLMAGDEVVGYVSHTDH